MGALVAFIANGIRMSYGVFAVPIEQAFNLTRSQAVLPFSLSMVVWGVAQPFTGAFMDSKGPRWAILISVILMALGFLAAAGAQNLWQLTLGYGLLVGGACSGVTVAAFSLLVNRWFQHQRGRVLGYALAGIPMGSLAFSPLTAALIVAWSWQGAFLILAAIMMLVTLPLSWLFLQEPAGAQKRSSTSASVGNLLFDGEVWQAIKSQPYWMILVKYFGCGFSTLLLSAHLPAIALEYGFSPQEGATALGVMGASGAVGAVLGGWASDRFGRYKSLAIGYLVRGVGLLLLAFSVSNVTSFYVISVVAGLPVFFTVAITQLVIYEVFGTGIAGRMIGLTFLLHQVGATIGPYFGGWMFETSGGYMLALVIGGGVLFNSAFWSWRLQSAVQRYNAAGASS
jgi:MFS family permease